MRFMLFIAFSLVSFFSFSQLNNNVTFDFKVDLRDAFGLPLVSKNPIGTEGSAFLFDEYKPGRITIKNRVYNKINVKLNLEKNIIFFEKDGVEMVPAENVNKIEIFDAYLDTYSHVFKNGFPAVGKNSNKTYL